MHNPFIGQEDICSVEALIGREEQIKMLRSFAKRRTDSVLFGPEGCGKTALLNSVFSVDYRMEQAKTGLLVHVGEFPVGMTGEDAYGYFADAIRSAVEILEFCGREEKQKMILDALDRVRADSKKSRFDQFLAKIEINGFRILFVLDNFENFTSSPEIKAEHHDLLCGMLNNHRMQLIVASNYDFNSTSLPSGIRNSLLLSRLSPNRIDLEPLNAKQCEACLVQILENSFCDFRFTSQQVEELWQISGGIPLLLNMAARWAFDALQCGDGNWVVTTREKTLEEALPLLKRWCKIMPEDQLALLPRAETPVSHFTDEDNKAAKALVGRGILLQEYDTNRSGQRIYKDGYRFNSLLLEQFSRNGEWLEEAAKSNPLREEKSREPVLSFDPMALLSGGAAGTIHIETLNIHNGDHIQNTYQPTVVADNGFGKLFHLLDLDRDELGEQLQKLFNAVPATPAVLDAEEAAKRITTMFIPAEVEEEEEDLEEYQEEQKTLQARFQSIRDKVDTNRLLDDELLNALNVKCRLYLQIAFVVEDALSVLNDFHLGDLSANMVMYGKVLEQQLRDQLYNLFHNDPQLKCYDSYTGQQGSNSKETFAIKKRNKSCIGDYTHMIEDKASYLGTLCRDNSVEYANQAANTQWWWDLCDDVNEARDLRNKTDHAGSETNRENLERMHTLLFGSGNILRRCFVGGALEDKLYPNPYKEQEQLEGQIMRMTDVHSNGRGGLKGIVEGTEYPVSISKKCLENRNLTTAPFLNSTFSVRLIRWDKNGEVFNAEPV